MRAAAASLRERAAGYFVAPRPPVVAEAAASRDAGSLPARSSPRAAVLGPAAVSAPVAGALAGGLRAVHAAPTAAVAIWAPPAAAAQDRPSLAVAAPAATDTAAGPPQPHSAAATPAALRLAARISTRGVPAAGRGRLAWAQLADHPVAMALAARRLSGALEVPLVLALAGPRAEVLEELLREQDLVVVVARDPEGALARLAIAGCAVPAAASAPLAAGPTRLLALAGLAGSRWLDPQLRTAVLRVAERPPTPPIVLHAPTADPARSDW